MRLSKIVAPASPVKQEQGANTSTKQEDCQQCQQEAKRKRLKMSDTVEGWLACLLKAETTEGAIAVWKDCDNIAWDRDERKQLGFKYVSHLAQLESLKRWGSKTKVQVFEKAILALPDYVPPPF